MSNVSFYSPYLRVGVLGGTPTHEYIRSRLLCNASSMTITTTSHNTYKANIRLGHGRWSLSGHVMMSANFEFMLVLQSYTGSW